MTVIYYPAVSALAEHAKAGRSVLRQTLSLFHYPSFSLYRCLPLSLSRFMPLSGTFCISFLLPLSCRLSVVIRLSCSILCLCFSPPSASLFAHIQTQTAVTRGRRLSPDTSLSGDIQTTLDCVCLLWVCVHPPLFIEIDR